MVSWFKSAMEESEKYIKAMSDCIPEIKDKSKPMSNADRIRSMTDEELANFLFGIDNYWDDGQLIVRIEDYALNASKGDILEWLQMEVEK